MSIILFFKINTDSRGSINTFLFLNSDKISLLMSIFFLILLFNRLYISSKYCNSSSWFIDTNLAASEGVEALLSDTKSDIVKSDSCPMADTIGIWELKIALANFSLLKGQRSSIDPPPLAIIMTSVL